MSNDDTTRRYLAYEASGSDDHYIIWCSHMWGAWCADRGYASAREARRIMGRDAAQADFDGWLEARVARDGAA